jgi:hypothetical protein
MNSAALQRLGLYGCLLIALAAAYFAPPAQQELTLAPRVQEMADPGQRAHIEQLSSGGKAVAGHRMVLEIRERGKLDGEPLPWTVFGVPASSVPLAASLPQSLARPQWQAIASASPASEAAPTPTAPPLPFRYLGRAQEGGRDRVFLQLGDRNLIVSAGDTVGQQYRVERIDEQDVTFVYLPMNVTQQLVIGSTQHETTR